MSTRTHTALHICHDRVVPDDYHPAHAAAERAAQDVVRQLVPEQAARDIDAGANPVEPVARLALISLKRWQPGSTLTCRFLDGSPKQRQRVEEKAHIWEQFANIKLQFVATGDAAVRISFTADPGSWSAIGTDALVERYFPKFQPTMNFGWLEDDTEDEEYERVVVHEFGHALGAIHEHQSPSAHLKWKKAEVYRVFSGAPNFWSKPDIDSNILEHYSARGLRFTRFDPDSIMLYMFPGNLFTDGKPTNENTHLSEQDKTFIAQMYPKNP